MSEWHEAAWRIHKGAYRGSQRYRCIPRRRSALGPSASQRAARFESPSVNNWGSNLRVVSFMSTGHSTRKRTKLSYLHSLTFEFDERLSRLTIVEPTNLTDLVPVHATEHVAARKGLRVRHPHLIAAALPRRRHPITLPRSPDWSGIVRSDGRQRLRFRAAVDLGWLELRWLRCRRLILAGGLRRRRWPGEGLGHRHARWSGGHVGAGGQEPGKSVLHRSRCRLRGRIVRV